MMTSSVPSSLQSALQMDQLEPISSHDPGHSPSSTPPSTSIEKTKRKRKYTDTENPTEPRRLRRSHEACARCRGKKIKCDSKHPKCSPCQAAGTECNQEDRHRQTVIPRGHTERLESMLAQADALLKRFIPGFTIENIDQYTAQHAYFPPPYAQPYYGYYPPAPPPPPAFVHTHTSPPAPPPPPPVIPGQDPQSNDMSTDHSLAKNFGVSAAITSGIPPPVSDEDLDVGSTGLSAYHNPHTHVPKDVTSWNSVAVVAENRVMNIWMPKDRPMVTKIIDIYFSRLNPHRPVLIRTEFLAKVDGIYSLPNIPVDSGLLSSVYLVLALGTLSESSREQGDSAPNTRPRPQLIPDNWPSHDELFQRALIYKPDLRTSISSLQALILLHWYLYTERAGRTLYRLVGILVRLAIELGLHHDPTKQKQSNQGNPPMEVPVFTPSECRLRIRLWHIVLLHDRGISILLGRPLAVRPEDSDVPPPIEPDEDEMSEHFTLSQPITEIHADIINDLYAPQPDDDGASLLRNAVRIIRRMSTYRRQLPSSYAWYFQGGALDMSPTAASTSPTPPNHHYLSESEGLNLLKYGIARVLLLRALFSSRHLPYVHRRLALVDAITTSHNIISIHSQLLNYTDIGFFTSPIPLHIAAMVILYGHMSKCDRLEPYMTLDDVAMALEMLPKFRWRWERKDEKGGHPLIAKLAEKVMEQPLENRQGPSRSPVIIAEVTQWDNEEYDALLTGANVHDGMTSSTTTPTVTESALPSYTYPPPAPPPSRHQYHTQLVDVPPSFFFPIYPEGNGSEPPPPPQSNGNANSNVSNGINQYINILSNSHHGTEGYIEEERMPPWMEGMHHIPQSN